MNHVHFQKNDGGLLIISSNICHAQFSQNEVFLRHPVVTQNSYPFINFGSYIICMAFRTFMKFLNCLITISCSWGKCFYWKLFDPLHGASRPTLATAAIFNTIPVVHCTVYQWNATWNCIFCSAQNSFFFFQKGSGRWQNGMTIREPFIYVLAEFVR